MSEEAPQPVKSGSKSLSRSLGEFFGHIVKAVKSDPKKKVVRKEIEEEQQPGMTLRRTTIEEVELRDSE